MKEKKDQNKFVTRIKELDLNPKVVSFLVGRSQSTISRWKSEENAPELKPRAMSRLCRLLDVSIDELAEIFEPEDDMASIDIESVAKILDISPEKLRKVLKPEE